MPHACGATIATGNRWSGRAALNYDTIQCKRELGLLFGEKRPTYHKPASPEVQDQFKDGAQNDMDEAVKDGFTVMYQDEMDCRPYIVTCCWHLPEDCEVIQTNSPR